jgi:hypothetical protein
MAEDDKDQQATDEEEKGQTDALKPVCLYCFFSNEFCVYVLSNYVYYSFVLWNDPDFLKLFC